MKTVQTNINGIALRSEAITHGKVCESHIMAMEDRWKV